MTCAALLGEACHDGIQVLCKAQVQEAISFVQHQHLHSTRWSWHDAASQAPQQESPL